MCDADDGDVCYDDYDDVYAVDMRYGKDWRAQICKSRAYVA